MTNKPHPRFFRELGEERIRDFSADDMADWIADQPPHRLAYIFRFLFNFFRPDVLRENDYAKGMVELMTEEVVRECWDTQCRLASDEWLEEQSQQVDKATALGI